MTGEKKPRGKRFWLSPLGVGLPLAAALLLGFLWAAPFLRKAIAVFLRMAVRA